MKTRSYTKHGMTGTKLHEVWKEMKRRCKGKNPKSATYIKRGITVCEKWEKAINFICWALENGYKEGLQIDRIDNNKGYFPGNCRWVTAKQNANNRINTRFLTFNGKCKNITDWSELTGIKSTTLHTRISRNWDVCKILTKGTKYETTKYTSQS